MVIYYTVRLQNHWRTITFRWVFFTMLTVCWLFWVVVRVLLCRCFLLWFLLISFFYVWVYGAVYKVFCKGVKEFNVLLHLTCFRIFFIIFIILLLFFCVVARVLLRFFTMLLCSFLIILGGCQCVAMPFLDYYGWLPGFRTTEEPFIFVKMFSNGCCAENIFNFKAAWMNEMDHESESVFLHSQMHRVIYGGYSLVL